MNLSETHLANLLAFSRDGEWGQERASEGLVEMRVIRGTDFSAVRFGDFNKVPTRYIPPGAAQKKQLHVGDILIETAGGTKDQPTGRSVLIKARHVAAISTPMVCASFARVLRVDPALASAEYVFWYLQYLYSIGELEQYQVQHTGVARFQYTSFSTSHVFRLPEKTKQDAVAQILGALDDKIELNRKTSETLEAMARALFKSWFVDFDPVRAKSEGRRPAGMNEETAKLFPAVFVETAFGNLPLGWSVDRLDNRVQLTGGKQLPAEQCQARGTYPVFGANGIMGFCERSTHSGIVFAFGRVGAYCGSVKWSYRGAWINNNALAIVPRKHPEFYLATMLDTDFSPMRTGSAQPFIPNSSVSSLRFVVGTAPLLDLFCSIVRPWRLLQCSLDQESETLASLRDTLIPKLMSGEIRIKDAEKLASAAL